MLKRQLSKSGATAEDGPPNIKTWHTLIDLIDLHYRENDNFIYTLERTSKISTNEMDILYGQLKERREKLQAIISEGLCFVDESFLIESINEKAESMLEVNNQEASGKSCFDIFKIFEDPETKHPVRHSQLIAALVEEGKPLHLENSIIYTINHKHFPAAIAINPIIREGRFYGAVLVFRDITERKQHEEELHRLASYDTLTGLPNRRLFQETFQRIISRNARSHSKSALLFLDLDNFKTVNDTLGHSTGDKLLKNTTDRLNTIIRKGDFLARIGGDEFAIILDDVQNETNISHIAQKILDCLKTPFHIDGHEVFSYASIGIACYPTGGKNTGELLQNADLAMYRAKKIGRNNYQYFTDSIDQTHRKRITLERSLQTALKNEEFSLLYQPKYDMKNNCVIGVEALIRWHNELGDIPPDEFIKSAENLRLMFSIGQWIIANACEQFGLWYQKGFIDYKYAVNLSFQQLEQDNLVTMISNLTKKYKIPAHAMEFELTETCLMSNAEHSEKILRTLSELGFNITIDDFGTGYSSLDRLRNLPIKTIKIDKSFIADIESNEDGATIVKTIINLSNNLGLNVIAEGVETVQQSTFLLQHGCIDAQGFLYSEPLPANEFEQLIENERRQKKGAT